MGTCGWGGCGSVYKGKLKRGRQTIHPSTIPPSILTSAKKITTLGLVPFANFGCGVVLPNCGLYPTVMKERMDGIIIVLKYKDIYF